MASQGFGQGNKNRRAVKFSEKTAGSPFFVMLFYENRVYLKWKRVTLLFIYSFIYFYIVVKIKLKNYISYDKK